MSFQQKLRGFRNAVGTWSNPWRRIEADQTAAKIRVWEQDKLIARGKAAALWQPVSSLTPGAVACTCVKNTTDSAQRQCDSCYGSKFVPGYLKFGHQTIFFSSAEYTGFTLSSVAISTATKPNLLQLTAGATTGTITTAAKPFTNPTVSPGTWEIRMDSFIRATGSTVTAQFSTDGITYYDINLINGANRPIGTGTIRFRITLTRLAVGDPSPSFEIIRLRRPLLENKNAGISRWRPYAAGQILILKTWVQDRTSLLEGRGRVDEHLQDRSWTAPLDFFDTSLARDTFIDVIDDTATGIHPFIEYQSDGVLQNTRYILEQISFNTQLGLFTHQSFVERKVQADEPGTFLVF